MAFPDLETLNLEAASQQSWQGEQDLVAAAAAAAAAVLFHKLHLHFLVGQHRLQDQKVFDYILSLKLFLIDNMVDV